MKMLFKQKFFSWFDSYDIFDENGAVLYRVKGQLAWGHCFRIYDAMDRELGMVKQRVFTWMPQYEMYIGSGYVGCIRREFTFFRPRYAIDCYGWQISGNWMEWDYRVVDPCGLEIATVSKELLHWTDTYAIEVHDHRNALAALMLVLAIDADKCSHNN